MPPKTTEILPKIPKCTKKTIKGKEMQPKLSKYTKKLGKSY